MKTKYYLTISLIVLGCTQISAQEIKVLFVGNSYTGVNDLPQMFSDVSFSAGDSVIVDRVTPGGYRFLNHSSDPNTLNKISSNTGTMLPYKRKVKSHLGR